MNTLRIVRGKIMSAVAAIGKLVRVKIAGLHDEEIEDVEVMSNYGFSSVPKADAECIAVQFGHRTIVISGADRRIVPDMQDGDVCVHSALGQYVILKDSGGIDIRTAQNVTVYASQIRLGDNALLPNTNGVVVPSCVCSYAGQHLQGSSTVMAKG
jgi:phage gp45-like